MYGVRSIIVVVREGCCHKCKARMHPRRFLLVGYADAYATVLLPAFGRVKGIRHEDVLLMMTTTHVHDGSNREAQCEKNNSKLEITADVVGG